MPVAHYTRLSETQNETGSSVCVCVYVCVCACTRVSLKVTTHIIIQNSDNPHHTILSLFLPLSASPLLFPAL